MTRWRVLFFPYGEENADGEPDARMAVTIEAPTFRDAEDAVRRDWPDAEIQLTYDIPNHATTAYTTKEK